MLPLSEKADEYILRLGYSNVHTLGVMVQLLTVGKIRLDFRDYHERLQLLNPADLMSRGEALHLVESHLSSIATQHPCGNEVMMTQKIIIQPPKK